MTVADKIMHPQHFGTDPTDIRIRINPKIRIVIPDHFWFKVWRWWRFALFESTRFFLKTFALSECSCYSVF